MRFFIDHDTINRYAEEAGLSVESRVDLQKKLALFQYTINRERAAFKKEIIEEILKQISVKVKADDAIKEINSVQDAINKLKGGK